MNEINTIIEASKLSLEKIKNIPSDFSSRMLTRNNDKNRIIIGPRGTGKSTYLLYEAKKYNVENVLFIDIDSAILSKYDFETNNNSLKSFKVNLIDILKSGKIKIIIFDEIQNLYNWNIFLKKIADTFEDIRILASGSDARKIAGASELGTRRYEIYFSGFYTYKEYKERFKNGSLDEYINNWSFAAGKKISDSEIFQSVYEKQIKLTRLKDFSIKNILKLIAYNPSSSFNINSMANKIFEDSNVRPDDTQLKMIIQFLIDSSLIYKINDAITDDRISKKIKYKLYASDWNLFKYFSGKKYNDLNKETIPRKGLIFENMVVSNIMAHNNLLIKREQIKTLVDEPDVDIIIGEKKIEIKSFDALDKNHSKYIKIIDKALKTKSIVVHTGETKLLKINPIQSIKYINIEKFLLNLNELNKIFE